MIPSVNNDERLVVELPRLTDEALNVGCAGGHDGGGGQPCGLCSAEPNKIRMCPGWKERA